MNIQMRLAVDRNHNHEIEEPDEVVQSLSELADRDVHDSGQLEGDELKDIYFSYFDDVWLAADRANRVTGDDFAYVLQLKRIDLVNGSVDMDIRIQPGANTRPLLKPGPASNAAVSRPSR